MKTKTITSTACYCFQRPSRRSLLGMCLLTAMACLGLLGCGTPNVNPPTPRADTGYVDLHTDSNLELSWQVKEVTSSGAEMRTLFSEFDPVQENILRLAVPPGTHTFQIWVMNRVTENPQIVTAQVENGRVTPIRVALEPTGTTSVQSKQYGFHPSAKGYARGTKIVSTDSPMYRISAAAAAPLPYQPKERMAYFAAQPTP